MDLYWFIPALVNNKVGSESGTTEDEGTVKSVSDILIWWWLRALHTKSVAMLLFEVVDESAANFGSRPFNLLMRTVERSSHDCGGVQRRVVV